MPAPPSAPPRLFDRARLMRRRDAIASQFSDYAFLKQRVSSDLAERLLDSPRSFPLALDLGGHTGDLAVLLSAGEQVSRVLCADISAQMACAAARRGLETICADEEYLPFAEASFDLVTSALSLHWVNDLPGTFIQIRRVLKPDGLFLAGLFAAGTLTELRESLIIAETEICGGAALRTAPMPGLKDLAGLLQRAGFALPVADRETVTVRYDDMRSLLADLKGMGERAVFARGLTRPMRRSVFERANEIYSDRFSDADGRVRASFEIAYLSGWAPGPDQPTPKKPGSAQIRLAEALETVRRQE